MFHQSICLYGAPAMLFGSTGRYVITNNHNNYNNRNPLPPSLVNFQNLPDEKLIINELGPIRLNIMYISSILLLQDTATVMKGRIYQAIQDSY